MTELKKAIEHQREYLENKLQEPLANIARRLSAVWPRREDLDSILEEAIRQIPEATFVYALNTRGIQLSDNISRSGVLPEHFGRDRSQRPYMKEVVPATGFLLSDAYISLLGRRPSLTALQLVRDSDGNALGFLGADFDLRNLPDFSEDLYEEPNEWRQIKGDPSIRGTLFLQSRTESLMDQNMDTALAIIEELFTERGVFQGVFHFSSSRATLWTTEDPYRYRILTHESLGDPDVCLAFPHEPYPEEALIPKDEVGRVLEGLKALRYADETIYLRSASINLFNGMVSLTFSCDGSHYMTWDEFLGRSIEFWIGATG
ncbi:MULTISPECIES: PDC sensor domain-containing protein [unclassified Thioalkalivibrio]|uniref:PDC sensor domain-containing protein n=1 Tax=unclassified Thioalkalivibrio TaxID=2621013 RepID=UPI0003661F44|nr:MULTISPECIES: PDC sensor domain-containing protein [unclassified Thioalkalivibrio]